MPTKKNTSDIPRSNSGNSYLSFSEWDEGNKPEKTGQAETAEPKKVGEQESDSEEGREAIRARRKNPQAEGPSEGSETVSGHASSSGRGSSDKLPSETTLGRKDNKGSPSSDSKDWALERMKSDPKSRKTEKW